jgi:serine protease Do
MAALTVVLGRRETSEAVAFPVSTEEVEPEVSEILGLTLSEITPELVDQFSLSVESGLVITTINPDSEAASKGLLEGDVITEAGQEAVASIADFEARVEAVSGAGRKSILLLVRRGGDPRFVALVLEE